MGDYGTIIALLAHMRSIRVLLPTLVFAALTACGGSGGSGSGSGGSGGTGDGDGDGDGADDGPTGGDDAPTGGTDGDGPDDDADGPDDGPDDDGTDGTDDGDDDAGGPLCGNGELDPGEDCDDGNRIDSDWCTSDCVVATCGDSIVWDAAETCDDGNRQDGDGCDANCVLESCGDGVLDPGEQCDLGPNNGAHGALCSTACVSAGVALQGENTFELDVEGQHGVDPGGVSLADFNADGRTDVVVAHGGGGGTVAYGQGDGRLWTPFARFAQGRHQTVIAADFDGDDRVDVATVSTAPNRINLLLGAGRGVGASAPTALASVPGNAASGDLDGDGDLDLVVVNPDASSVTLAINDGTGSFDVGTTISTAAGGGGLNPHAAAVGDVSGDGVADIVTANGDADFGDMTVFVGMGGGVFGVGSTYAVGGHSVEDVALADLDDDGRADVIGVATNGDEVAVMLAGPDGVLSVANDYPVDGLAPQSLAVGDVDGDGTLDIVTADFGSDSVSVLIGIPGGGAFEIAEGFGVALPDDPGAGAVGRAGREPTDVALVDLDEDGDLDIVTANGRSRDLTVVLGEGDGGFGAPAAYEFVSSTQAGSTIAPAYLATGDFDLDDDVDVVAVHDAVAEINIVAGTGDGRLLPADTMVGTTWTATEAATGDLDGDGRRDFVLVANNAYGLRGGRQLPSGAFDFEVLSSDGLRGVAAGDVDEDGEDEVLSFASGVVTNYDGLFSDNPTTTTSDAGSSFGQALTLADATGDGLLDVVTTFFGQDEVRLLAGTGGDIFGGPNPVPTLNSDGGQGPVGLVVAELSGDEHLDIVTANNDTADLSIILGLGNGAFAEAVGVDMGLPEIDLWQVAVGDFNGDLVPDLAAMGVNDAHVGIAIGFGNGNFADPQFFDLSVVSRDVAAADLDGDGIADLVLTGADSVVSIVSAGHTIL